MGVALDACLSLYYGQTMLGLVEAAGVPGRKSSCIPTISEALVVGSRVDSHEYRLAGSAQTPTRHEADGYSVPGGR